MAGRDVLEFGCGGAQWSISLAKRGARCTGLDNSQRQLDHARATVSAAKVNLRLVHGAAEAPPFADACFDIVFWITVRWDNAVVESFNATIKTELIHRTKWNTREEARAAIYKYIEIWYNAKRLHSTLGYQSRLRRKSSWIMSASRDPYLSTSFPVSNADYCYCVR